jgi:hypothetical protein
MLDSTYLNMLIVPGICVCTVGIECSGGWEISAGFTLAGSVVAKFAGLDHKYLFIFDKYVFRDRDTRPV